MRNEQGFTLIELLITMLIGVVVTGAAFSFLQFTTEDTSRITDRVHVDQVGRTALERIMLELHSSCVTPLVNPILEKSNENVIRFISESGTKSAFATVDEHEIIYTAATGTTEGTLVEKTYKSTGPGTKGNYIFETTPAGTTKLLTGVRQTVYKGEEATPIFQYYHYYQKGETIPTEDHGVAPYGELNPIAISAKTTGSGLSETQANEITKVVVNFTLAPEGKESATFNHDRPVVLEDSAVFRVAPSSEATSNPNLPCSPET
jgi:prepilin-type N-terminal cleavage/methylation domain-containing protein